MKVTVDEDLCIGTGNCVENSETVFEIDGGISHVKVDVVPSGEEENVRSAVEECPTGAISIIEE
jgi:ferredoxin